VVTLHSSAVYDTPISVLSVIVPHPFQRQLENPRNFFCPDSRHSPSNPTPPPTPPYSASSDEESEREVDSYSSIISPKKISGRFEG
jgi:hypothetical protein